MNGFDWYVVQSHPRKEGFARGRIEDLDREVFLPMVKERISGTRRQRLAPLFPGYLFARLSESAGDFPRIRWSPGVRRLLGNGDQPRPIGEAILSSLRARTDSSGRLRLGRRLRKGDQVRIVEGPLSGLVGVLDRPVAGPEHRVAVLLEVFHRLTRVEIPATAVWANTG